MEHLAVVAALLAIATFATGLVLPLSARRRRDTDDAVDRVAADELASWR